LRICARIDTSSAETGSSHTIGHGLHRQCPGNDDALALPARELVGKPGRLIGAQAHLLKQLSHAPGALVARHDAVEHQRLGEDLADRHARIEGGEGVLKDDLHLAPKRPQAALGEVRDVFTVDPHPALIGGYQPHGKAPQGGLATARFTDQSQRLAGLQGQGYAVDGLGGGARPAEERALHHELLAHVIHLEDRPCGVHATSFSNGARQHRER
jgi:hypothetical protein